MAEVALKTYETLPNRRSVDKPFHPAKQAKNTVFFGPGGLARASTTLDERVSIGVRTRSMPPPHGLCIIPLTADPDRRSIAERLACSCRAPLVDRAQVPENTALALVVGDRGMSLHTADALDRGGVCVDLRYAFEQPAHARLTRRQPLARAIGPPGQFIADATAGFGADAAMFAAYGCQVLAIERSPVLGAMLADALAQAREDQAHGEAIAARLQVAQGDARDVLRAVSPGPDVAYLDPMFPAKRRGSALPPKAAQMLRLLVGSDDDAADLLTVAREVARVRVVVKRPDHAAPISEPVDATYRGKLVRYDVYVSGAGT